MAAPGGLAQDLKYLRYRLDLWPIVWLCYDEAKMGLSDGRRRHIVKDTILAQIMDLKGLSTEELLKKYEEPQG